MKKNIKFKLLGFLFLLFAFASCDTETAEQDVSPVISPANKPTVTLTTDFSGTAMEGDTIVYTIAFNKTIDRAVTFTPDIIGGTANSDDYEELSSVTMQPYTTEATFTVVLNSDYLIEETETLDIQLEILGIAEKYLLHPDTVIPAINISFANHVDSNKLVINFAWDTDDDMDMATWSDTSTYPSQIWGLGGATGANPEIDHAIWLDDPAGDYYVSIIDWDAGVTFNYTFTIQTPDGSVQTITGTWDPANAGDYTADIDLDNIGNYNIYRVLKVVNNNTTFVVTAL